jgi:hypothetical protein
MSGVSVLPGRSKWPRGLRRSSAAALLLGLQVRMPGALISVSCVCSCVAKWMSLHRAHHSSRGVLPSVVCLSVIVKPQHLGGPSSWTDECLRATSDYKSVNE